MASQASTVSSAEIWCALSSLARLADGYGFEQGRPAAAPIVGSAVGSDSRDLACERRRLDTADFIVAWRTHKSRGEEAVAFVPRGVRPIVRIV